MHFPVEGTRKTLVFFTILTSWTIALGETSGDKTLDIKIGFDLTQGTNGAPALRIRDFQDSDASLENKRRPRAEIGKEEGEVHPQAPAIRADSFSDNDGEDKVINEESSREEEKESSEGSENDSGSNRHRSTKGLEPEEFEAEANAKVHGRFDADDDSEEDGRKYRYRKKREIDYEVIKRKSKKFASARKQRVTIDSEDGFQLQY